MADSPKKADVQDHATMVANTLAVWERVTKEDLTEGINWYVEAYELAHDIAAGTSYTPDQIAGVISAMSPRMPWGRNKTVTRMLVERHATGDTYKGIGLGSNCFTSYVILSGNATPLQMLQNKREAFYLNITGDTSRGTIDSWMIKVLFGPETGFVSPGTWYEECESALADAASIAGINTRDFQAACWVRIRKDMLTEKERANFEKE